MDKKHVQGGRRMKDELTKLNITLSSNLEINLACPTCGEHIYCGPYDEDKMFKRIVIHCWQAHDTTTKEELYALFKLQEEEK